MKNCKTITQAMFNLIVSVNILHALVVFNETMSSLHSLLALMGMEFHEAQDT